MLLKTDTERKRRMGKKKIILNLNDSDDIALIGKALSQKIRIDILKLSITRSVNIKEIANTFSIPASTAALHVKVLENAGLISASEKPGERGIQKVCGIAFEDIYINAFRHMEAEEGVQEYQFPMPIGNYYDLSVVPTCGLISEETYIGVEDSPYSFYLPDRGKAQLIWFQTGFLEYRFPNCMWKRNLDVRELSFSFEACSEAPGYQNDWKSDISVWVNDVQIATILSQGDFGGRRGILNPEWWADTMTQYGRLHRLTINRNGCYENGVQCSEVGLDKILKSDSPYISFKIGVKEDALHAGGINLFGEKFGDYQQGIIMTVRTSLQSPMSSEL